MASFIANPEQALRIIKRQTGETARLPNMVYTSMNNLSSTDFGEKTIHESSRSMSLFERDVALVAHAFRVTSLTNGPIAPATFCFTQTEDCCDGYQLVNTGFTQLQQTASSMLLQKALSLS